MSDFLSPRRVNRAVAAQANIFFLHPAHLRPLALSLIFGIIVGQICSLDTWGTLLLMVWPLSTWLIVVGKDPRVFLAKFYRHQSRWIRIKVVHTDPFHKKKVGQVRVHK